MLRLRVEQEQRSVVKTVPLIFEDSLPSYFFETPFFCESQLEFPAFARLEISLDGTHFMATELVLTVLDSKVKLREIHPKFLSHKGGQDLCMRLDLKKIFGKEQVSAGPACRSGADELPRGGLGLEHILQKNCGNLMIAFKQILHEGPTPNFKNLRNNSVIDNDLFLRQKMVLSRHQLRGEGLLEANNRHLRIAVSEAPFGGNRENSMLKSHLSNLANSGTPSLLPGKRSPAPSKRSLRESRAGDSGATGEAEDESSGWKLVEAELRDGVVYCQVPEVDLRSGKLVMFNRLGILAKIRANDYNSSGKKLLEEVTQWLSNKSQTREASSRLTRRPGPHAQRNQAHVQLGLLRFEPGAAGKTPRDARLRPDAAEPGVDRRAAARIPGWPDQKSHARASTPTCTASSTSGWTCA